MSATIDQMIEVLRAAQNGETIQWRWRTDTEWKESAPNKGGAYTLTWNFSKCDYRAKPKEVTLYVNVYGIQLFGHETLVEAEKAAAAAGTVNNITALAVPFTFTPGEET